MEYSCTPYLRVTFCTAFNKSACKLHEKIYTDSRHDENEEGKAIFVQEGIEILDRLIAFWKQKGLSVFVTKF